jgi:GTP-binding protein LepA
MRMISRAPPYLVDRGRRVHAEAANRRAGPGEIGFFTAAIKEVADTRVGDTITEGPAPTPQKALPGFKPSPSRWCSAGSSRRCRPTSKTCGRDGQAAAQRCQLLVRDGKFGAALGFGFRCGFLGLLHLEIIQERLEREFNLDLIATAPSVSTITMTDGDRDRAAQPGRHARPGRSTTSRSPGSGDHHGAGRLSRLDPEAVQDRRGPDSWNSPMRAAAPWSPTAAAQRGGVRLLRPAEVGLPGYASFDYQMSATAQGDLVKMRSWSIPSRSTRCRSSCTGQAERAGRMMCEKLKELIPRHMFKIPIQAAIGGQGHRARNDFRAAQGRDRQVLRRRHHPQTQAAGKAEGGQEEDAPVRQGRNPAGGLHLIVYAPE